MLVEVKPKDDLSIGNKFITGAGGWVTSCTFCESPGGVTALGGGEGAGAGAGVDADAAADIEKGVDAAAGANGLG